MADYIDREAAIEAVDKRIEELRTHESFSRKTQCEIIDLSGVKTYLSALPSADVKPVVRGKWKDYSNEGYVECPLCYHATNCEGNIDDLHFCFWCGADMRGEQDE